MFVPYARLSTSPGSVGERHRLVLGEGRVWLMLSGRLAPGLASCPRFLTCSRFDPFPFGLWTNNNCIYIAPKKIEKNVGSVRSIFPFDLFPFDIFLFGLFPFDPIPVWAYSRLTYSHLTYSHLTHSRLGIFTFDPFPSGL